MTDSPELSEAQSRAVAAAVREQLAKRRISRQRLADDAKISVSTLEKALGGSRPFTLSTLLRLEEALGLSLRPKQGSTAREQKDRFAPEHLGAYAHPAVAWLEGDYLTLRPSFERKDVLYAYRTRIAWDDAEGCLAFQESERLDAPFAQKGVVSLPNKSGHIYLHTNEAGQMRLAILGRPLISGEIYGILTTLVSGAGAQLTPAATPIAFVPLLSGAKAEFGQIAKASQSYDRYREHLARAAGDFVRLVTP